MSRARIILGWSSDSCSYHHAVPDDVESRIPVDLMPPYANPAMIDADAQARTHISTPVGGYCFRCEVWWDGKEEDGCWVCGSEPGRTPKRLMIGQAA